MLEESVDKLQDIEVHGARAATSLLFVAEVNLAVFYFDDTAVGDSDAEDVRGQVFQA